MRVIVIAMLLGLTIKMPDSLIGNIGSWAVYIVTSAIFVIFFVLKDNDNDNGVMN